MCWLCHQSVPINYDEQSPISPSRDHVVPKSKLKRRNAPQGDFANNKKLAHKWCNEHRGNKSPKEPEHYVEGLIDAQLEYEVLKELGALV